MNSEFKLPTQTNAPVTYNSRAFNLLLRAIYMCFSELKGPGPIYGTTINLANLPTSSAGLKTGDVWNDAGTLKIV